MYFIVINAFYSHNVYYSYNIFYSYNVFYILVFESCFTFFMHLLLYDNQHYLPYLLKKIFLFILLNRLF